MFRVIHQILINNPYIGTTPGSPMHSSGRKIIVITYLDRYSVLQIEKIRGIFVNSVFVLMFLISEETAF